MLRTACLVTLPFLILASAHCSSSSGEPSGTGNEDPTQDPSQDPSSSKPTALLTPSHGSSIAVSSDDSIIVAANKDTGTASIFSVDYSGDLPTITKKAEIEVGAEPNQVAIHPSGNIAFVLSRKDQKLVRISGLRTTPSRNGEAATGSEPTGLAISPTGATAYVANMVDGTVSVITTETMKVEQAIDLNGTLAATGYLGTVDGRPSLAHPRSLAITNNLDLTDADETLYVADYSAYTKTQLAADGSNADTNKVGVVYKIPLASKTPAIIELPALADMGFKDINDQVAGCYPNQIQGMHIQGGFGYVLSLCASPKGPTGLSFGPAAAACASDATCPGAVVGSCVASKCTTNCTTDVQCGANGGKCGSNNVCAPNPANVKTWVTPAVSIVDLGGNKTIATVNLNKEFSTYYDQIGRPDDATRRMPFWSVDIGFVPGSVTAYVAAMGTDAVFKVDFDATYAASTVNSVGDAKNAFINLSPAGVDPSKQGKLPTGIVLAHKPRGAANTRFAFTNNEVTRNVTVVDLANQEVAGLSSGTPVVAESSAPPKDAFEQSALTGRWMATTALGRWSWKGQGWGACAACHGDGLSDNISWIGGNGGRQPPTLEVKDRIMGWRATSDEPTDHEGGTRSFAGGIGAIVKHAGLDFTSRLDVAGQTGISGSSMAVADPANPANLATPSVLDDWKKIADWLAVIRSPRRPTNLEPAKVDQGKALYTQGNCQGCHNGLTWTLAKRFYTPDYTQSMSNSLRTISFAQRVTDSGFPTAVLATQNPALMFMRSTNTALDQMLCMVRNVGTYGVFEPGQGLMELKPNGTPGAGNEADAKGFNVPSLLGMSMGAPYFHGGQARTLEAVLSDPFGTHLRAFTPGFLAADDPQRKEKVAALVQFILSIDNDQTPIAAPALGPTGGNICATQ